MITLFGIWEGTTKDGDHYFSMSLGMCKVMVFKNRKREGRSDPDWRVCIAANEKRTTEGLPNSAPGTTKDEIPF